MQVTISIIEKLLKKEGVHADRIDFLMDYLTDRHQLLEELYLRETQNIV